MCTSTLCVYSYAGVLLRCSAGMWHAGGGTCTLYSSGPVLVIGSRRSAIGPPLGALHCRRRSDFCCLAMGVSCVSILIALHPFSIQDRLLNWDFGSPKGTSSSSSSSSSSTQAALLQAWSSLHLHVPVFTTSADS